MSVELVSKEGKCLRVRETKSRHSKEEFLAIRVFSEEERRVEIHLEEKQVK